ncbi:MAG: methionyl-tRNA formyltransferase [Treponema sp.]|jgi:methionyl-tRNA formyltransferase|nr:methionyl-tRNA formyltransferase [Treponema sp.]
MRILFAGSPAIAIPALETLAALERRGICELAGVLTSPDSRQGRRGTLEPAAIVRAAREFLADPEAALLKPEKLGQQAREAAAALKPDLLVSFAYGRIFGPKFLSVFPLGGINIHPSLLPRCRGPSPIQAAILGRVAQTGVSIQRLALEMDSGDILAQERIPLCGRETAPELSRIAAGVAAAMLEELIPRFSGGIPATRPQDHAQATYCPLVRREDGRIDWTLAAEDIDARIRAYDPWPLCAAFHGERELFILAGRPFEGNSGGQAAPGTVLGIDKGAGILVQTGGGGILAVSRLQYQAKKALEWRAFLNGAKDFIGARLL